MSLLMEALRKAEEEKKRAAQEQQLSSTQEGAAGADTGSTTGETTVSEPGARTDSLIDTSRLSLEPIDVARQPSAAAPGESGAMTEISLEDLHEPTTRFQLEPGAGPAEAGPDEPTMRRPELPDQEHAAAESESEDMEATKPSQKAVQSSVQEYFEASQSMSMDKQRAQADMAVGDSTGATPVSAHTVFSAKSRRSTSRLLAYVTVVVLLLAAGLGAVGVWYYTGTPATQAPLSPLLAHNVEKPASPPLKLPAVEAPAPPAHKSAPSAGNVETVAPEFSQAPAETAPPAQPGIAAANGSAGNNEAVPTGVSEGATATTTTTVEAATPAAIPESAAAATPSEASATAPAPAKKPPTLSWSPPPMAAAGSDVMPGQLQIQRVPAQMRVNEKVEAAYAAYQSGNLNRAETLYREVLAREPDQRDALLGIAALATRRGDRNEAVDYYNRVLALDPHDAYANAAMVALLHSNDPVSDESRLKSMLGGAPDSAYVNFMLGNTYARQSRWADAQQAYFNAYSHDSHNADYAYNLAVSLDHLGQRRAASEYYQKALALADNRTTGFTPAQVQTRIKALAGGDTGTAP